MYRLILDKLNKQNIETLLQYNVKQIKKILIFFTITVDFNFTIITCKINWY